MPPEAAPVSTLPPVLAGFFLLGAYDAPRCPTDSGYISTPPAAGSGRTLEPGREGWQYPPMTTPRKTTYAQRQAARALYRVKRDADIREAVKAGVPLIVLGMQYRITMERVRQISRTPAPVAPVVG